MNSRPTVVIDASEFGLTLGEVGASDFLQHLDRERIVTPIDELDGAIVLCGLGRFAADGVAQDIGVEKRALGTRAPMLVPQLTRPASTVASHDTTNGTEATSSSGCARRRHSQKPYCRGSTKSTVGKASDQM